MELEKIIEDYSFYREIAIRIDLVIIGINLCILVVLLSQRRYADKKLKLAFIIHILAVILLLCVEIISWYMMFKEEYRLLFKVMVTLDYCLYLLMPVITFQLINKMVDYKVKINKTFRNTLQILFLAFALPLLIPPFRDLVLNFSDKIVGYTLTKFGSYYIIFELVLVGIGLGVGLKNAKRIGAVDSIIIVIFLLIPSITLYLNYWWASTVGMVFMCFTTILLVGLSYQSRLTLERERIVENKLELSDAKTKLLLTQIQPHFLYNTLSTLKYLCDTEPSKATELCDDFASYLRSNIDAVNDDGLVTFEKELENIKSYLKIEKARFEERINYIFDIKEKDFLIPVLSIQTIVENSVKKGICKKANGGTVIVSTRLLENGEEYEIKVSDDGAGFDLSTYLNDGKNHVGLINTRQRLELIGGSVNVESKIGIGTVVTVIIPKEKRILE